MTIKELIQELSKYPDDKRVFYFDDSYDEIEVQAVELASILFEINDGVLLR